MFYDVLLALIKEKADYAFVNEFRRLKSQQAAIIKQMRDEKIYTEEQIQKIARKKVSYEFEGNFEMCIESFAKPEMDYTIDLINEVRLRSAAISKRFKLNKERADERINEDTGSTSYFTSKHFIYGVFIVNIWRATI